MPTTSHDLPAALTSSAFSIEPASAVTAFQMYAHFESIDPEENRARFYDLQWALTLWGGEALIRVWGRVGTRGQTKVTFFPTREHAQSAVERLIRDRLAHGYHSVGWQL